MSSDIVRLIILYRYSDLH